MFDTRAFGEKKKVFRNITRKSGYLWFVVECDWRDLYTRVKEKSYNK